MRISDWSSDVCSSDLDRGQGSPARMIQIAADRAPQVPAVARKIFAHPRRTLRQAQMLVLVRHDHHRELAVDLFAGDIGMEKVAVRVPEAAAGAATPNRLQQGGLPSPALARPAGASLLADPQ